LVCLKLAQQLASEGSRSGLGVPVVKYWGFVENHAMLMVWVNGSAEVF